MCLIAKIIMTFRTLFLLLSWIISKFIMPVNQSKTYYYSKDIYNIQRQFFLFQQYISSTQDTIERLKNKQFKNISEIIAAVTSTKTFYIYPFLSVGD